jgi:uncharacterized membrane protein
VSPTGGQVLNAQDLSANGSIVTGNYGPQRGFIWENGTAIDIGLPAGKTSIEKVLISADASVVAVTANSNAGVDRAAYFWNAGVFTPIPRPSGGFGFQPEVAAVSADGTVVVGDNAGLGFRWENGVTQFILLNSPVDVSADGSVIIGSLGSRPAV